MEIEKALTQLSKLLSIWKLKANDYVLVDEFAYLLQGYDLNGPEIKEKHLDLYVNPRSLPWEPKKERSTIPPVESKYETDYEEFMRTSGYSLDLLIARPGILEAKRANYPLPGEISFPLMEVQEMTHQFAKQTLLHYSLEDAGRDKILEWLKKLEKIYELSKLRKDNRFSKVVKGLLKKSKNRWADLI